MKTPCRAFSALISFAMLSVAVSAVDRVKIDSGELKGSVSGQVVAFKGIPYAAPPVGQNRWRPPQPVQPWSGVRPATDFAADCMQLPFPSDAAPLGTKPAEECLYVNVWEPVNRTGSPLPVMVWFYGGGFVNGGSSPAVYDGSHFAERGVMLVSFNYRVGRFGFFAHPALTKENPDGPLGNYAFMDQIAALKWVQRNAAAFGGDPNNVTIFGESAGGMSVLTMLTSPMAKGLFQKAIVESGGGRALLGPDRYVTKSSKVPSGEEVGVAFAKQMGITGEDAAALTALRALPAERVVNGLNMASMNTPTYSGPMIDGRIVVESTEEAFLQGREQRVPLMDGANSSDIGFSMAKTMDEVFTPFGTRRTEAEQAYNSQHSTDVRTVGSAIAANRMMIEPARFIVRQMTTAGEPVYEFRFSYVASSMRKQWTGAPHATEIPYVFDTVAARYGKDLTPEDEKTARAANEYWANFAKTGDPNGRGLPKWPRYSPEQDVLLNFTETGPVAQPDPWKQRLDLVEPPANANKSPE